jgi:MFS family permease
LFIASAIGALGASLSVARFADSPHALLIYSVMAIVFGLGLVALTFAPNLTWATGVMLLVGVGNGGFQALNNAVIARETEPEYMGRVMSLTMLAFAGFGLMALPVGALADYFGEQATLAILGIVVILTAWTLGTALSRKST